MLRFTQGELFLPMRVEDYLEKCSLWRTGAGHGRGQSGESERLCAPGELTPARLAQFSAPGPELSLRFVERPLGSRELRAWRRDDPLSLGRHHKPREGQLWERRLLSLRRRSRWCRSVEVHVAGGKLPEQRLWPL